ncbi:hypothetical protein D5R40_26345, partial [Okeania hirsuta]
LECVLHSEETSELRTRFLSVAWDTEADKWTNRKVIKLSKHPSIPKIAMGCRTTSQRVNG